MWQLLFTTYMQQILYTIGGGFDVDEDYIKLYHVIFRRLDNPETVYI